MNGAKSMEYKTSAVKTSHELLQPQEIEVFYIIPTLRNQLAIAMKEQGLKQKQIAVLLGIEPATVSQYLHEKRGNKIEFSKEIIDEIKISAFKIKDRLSLLKEMQRLLRIMRTTREICKLHKQLSNIPSECTPESIECFGGDFDGPNTRICSR